MACMLSSLNNSINSSSSINNNNSIMPSNSHSNNIDTFCSTLSSQCIMDSYSISLS